MTEGYPLSYGLGSLTFDDQEPRYQGMKTAPRSAMKRQIIFLCVLTLLVVLGGCDVVVDRESQALESEALALVRTLRYDPNATETNAPVISEPTSAPTTGAVAFAPTEVIPEPAEQVSTPIAMAFPTEEVIPSVPLESPTPEATATPVIPKFPVRVVNPNASGANWRDLPVVPTSISETTRAVFSFGQSETDRNQRFFSKIGDCQSMPDVFLGEYDPYYLTTEVEERLGSLNQAVNYFKGYNDLSYSVFNGMSAASALSTMWSDPSVCLKGESAIKCELRMHRPAFVFVNLGTNWDVGSNPEIFASYFEEIVIVIMESGAVPILMTKTDNVEGDWALNAIVARTAMKFDVPFFNAWKTIQHLPNHGMDSDRKNIYMTTDAWPYRSRAALEVLDFLGRGLGLY